MSGWAEFWSSLEKQARPHVEAELAKVGWKLVGTSPWKAEAPKGRVVEFPIVTARSPDDLITGVREQEAAAARTCCEGECPECFGGEDGP